MDPQLILMEVAVLAGAAIHLLGAKLGMDAGTQQMIQQLLLAYLGGHTAKVVAGKIAESRQGQEAAKILALLQQGTAAMAAARAGLPLALAPKPASPAAPPAAPAQ